MKQVPESEKSPTAYVAELFGLAPEAFVDRDTAKQRARLCPFRDDVCDVTANRNSVATLDLAHKTIPAEERDAILATFGSEPLPLGICSCWTTRRYQKVARPWILCPKRLLSLEPPRPVIPREVSDLMDFEPGSRVGVWRELKFPKQDKTSLTGRFFEYTFDFLLMRIEGNEPVGAPYIVEVMTSSTRGGGLQEHMADVLLGRKQRHLGDIVKSVYTPNYRQVFERMMGQLCAKSEIGEAWGGKAIWVLQDVLLEYIEQTTAFDSKALANQKGGNVYMEVYGLDQGAKVDGEPGLHLAHRQSLRGLARAQKEYADYTDMLGLGHAPTLDELKQTLRNKLKAKDRGAWFEFKWGEQIDPRQAETTPSA